MVQLTKTNKKFTDISLSFQPNPLNGDISVLKDERAINNALKNIIMTSLYEKPFDSMFGSTVNRILFEPADTMTADDLQFEIKRAIARNEPRVKVEFVDVRINYDTGDYNVKIKYLIVGYDEVLNVDFILTPTTT